MSSNDRLFGNIPQLNSDKDWQVWKFQVTHALKAACQWEFVTGTAEATAQGYLANQQKAFYSILQCIGQRNIPAVMKCEDPKELWDTLCELFERKTVCNKVNVLMQLYRLCMKKGESICDHLRQLDELVDQLTALQENISEFNKVAVLLQSVQESYPTLVTALIARGDEELTLIFVKQALLDEEQRQNRSSGAGSIHRSGRDSALKAGYKTDSRRCCRCGEVGHFQRDCRKPLPGEKTIKKRYQRHRHYADHIEEKPVKITDGSVQSESESDSQVTFVAHEATAMTAETQDEGWIIDSGASRHMTFQLVNIRNYKEFDTPELVGLGDGHTVNVLGTGSVKIISRLPNKKHVTGWLNNVLYIPKLEFNLFSVRESASNGNVMSFGRKCWIRNRRKQLVSIGTPVGKLYKLECEVVPCQKQVAHITKEDNEKINLWHRRLGHVNIQQLGLLLMVMIYHPIQSGVLYQYVLFVCVQRDFWSLLWYPGYLLGFLSGLYCQHVDHEVIS
jgi:hypothetical protein